ncbi:hypothetical protein BC835DRAFT_1303480 [Cytidiella melzeri]|nr:hypothetical protein BC835DRAFT_1303480 [Cytidiella melzeri]
MKRDRFLGYLLFEFVRSSTRLFYTRHYHTQVACEVSRMGVSFIYRAWIWMMGVFLISTRSSRADAPPLRDASDEPSTTILILAFQGTSLSQFWHLLTQTTSFFAGIIDVIHTSSIAVYLGAALGISCRLIRHGQQPGVVILGLEHSLRFHNKLLFHLTLARALHNLPKQGSFGFPVGEEKNSFVRGLTRKSTKAFFFQLTMTSIVRGDGNGGEGAARLDGMTRLYRRRTLSLLCSAMCIDLGGLSGRVLRIGRGSEEKGEGEGCGRNSLGDGLTNFGAAQCVPPWAGCLGVSTSRMRPGESGGGGRRERPRRRAHKLWYSAMCTPLGGVFGSFYIEDAPWRERRRREKGTASATGSRTLVQRKCIPLGGVFGSFYIEDAPWRERRREKKTASATGSRTLVQRKCIPLGGVFGSFYIEDAPWRERRRREKGTASAMGSRTLVQRKCTPLGGVFGSFYIEDTPWRGRRRREKGTASATGSRTLVQRKCTPLGGVFGSFYIEDAPWRERRRREKGTASATGSRTLVQRKCIPLGGVFGSFYIEDAPWRERRREKKTASATGSRTLVQRKCIPLGGVFGSFYIEDAPWRERRRREKGTASAMGSRTLVQRKCTPLGGVFGSFYIEDTPWRGRRRREKGTASATGSQTLVQRDVYPLGRGVWEFLHRGCALERAEEEGEGNGLGDGLTNFVTARCVPPWAGCLGVSTSRMRLGESGGGNLQSDGVVLRFGPECRAICIDRWILIPLRRMNQSIQVAVRLAHPSPRADPASKIQIYHLIVQALSRVKFKLIITSIWKSSSLQNFHDVVSTAAARTNYQYCRPRADVRRQLEDELTHLTNSFTQLNQAHRSQNELTAVSVPTQKRLADRIHNVLLRPVPERKSANVRAHNPTMSMFLAIKVRYSSLHRKQTHEPCNVSLRMSQSADDSLGYYVSSLRSYHRPNAKDMKGRCEPATPIAGALLIGSRLGSIPFEGDMGFRRQPAGIEAEGRAPFSRSLQARIIFQPARAGAKMGTPPFTTTAVLGITLDNTVGAFLIGGFFDVRPAYRYFASPNESRILYGITTMQTVNEKKRREAPQDVCLDMLDPKQNPELWPPQTHSAANFMAKTPGFLEMTFTLLHPFDAVDNHRPFSDDTHVELFIDLLYM